MKLEDAQLDFIQTWGILGSEWGIPKSMGQIHGLLLTSHKGLSAEDVMDKIQLSRGNVNLNMRELIEWGLVAKKTKLGERKEFFQAEYDVWKMAISIVEKRKKKELEPVQELLRRLKDTKLDGKKDAVKHFESVLEELNDFVNQMDQLTELMTKMKNNLFFKKMIKVVSKKK